MIDESPPPGDRARRGGLTIGIDVRKVRDYGIGRYLEGLLGAFAASGGEERFVLFEADGAARGAPAALRDSLPPDRFRFAPLRAPLYSARELLAFRGVAARFSLDLLHFPHYVRALAPGCPVAVTLHDAIHLTHPPSRVASWYARAMMTWSARTAACAFTVSAAARVELARRLGVPAGRFRVTPNGVDARFRPPSDDSVRSFRDRRGLERPFVLCMASHRPHKNLRAAVDGFSRAALPDAELVLPARDDEAAAHLSPFATAVGVRLLDGVPDDELPALYAAARIVLCPSRAEGFGLPGLEAAACGGVVLATAIPAHREVLKDAASYVPEPGDAAAIAEALGTLWADHATRQQLQHAGPDRASRFDWDRTARLTLQGYREAIRGPGPANL